jgi:hypothetical protein
MVWNIQTKIQAVYILIDLGYCVCVLRKLIWKEMLRQDAAAFANVDHWVACLTKGLFIQPSWWRRNISFIFLQQFSQNYIWCHLLVCRIKNIYLTLKFFPSFCLFQQRAWLGEQTHLSILIYVLKAQCSDTQKRLVSITVSSFRPMDRNYHQMTFLNDYLTTLFDVYYMLSQSIHCMHTLPTKCILHLASHLYKYI